MQQQEMIFADGLSVKKISDNLFSLTINTEKFNDFMASYHNEKGYLKIDLRQSKKDASKWFAHLNTWQPTPKELTENSQLGNDEIPF